MKDDFKNSKKGEPENTIKQGFNVEKMFVTYCKRQL